MQFSAVRPHMQFATPRSPTKDGSFTDTASVIGPMWSLECWYDRSVGSTTSIRGGGPRINSWHILAYMPGNVRSLAAKSTSSLWWSTTSTMFLLSMAGQYRFKDARRGIVWQYLYKTQSRTVGTTMRTVVFSTRTHLSGREPLWRNNANRFVFPHTPASVVHTRRKERGQHKLETSASTCGILKTGSGH